VPGERLPIFLGTFDHSFNKTNCPDIGDILLIVELHLYDQYFIQPFGFEYRSKDVDLQVQMDPGRSYGVLNLDSVWREIPQVW
jgi:hypothetical protein